MLLAVDIGNTNVVIGVFDGPALRTHRRVGTDDDLLGEASLARLHDLFRDVGVSAGDVDDAVIASVVPDLTKPWMDAVERIFGLKPLLVSHTLQLPIQIDVERPVELGADRIANVVAGFARFGGPVLVVDFGTATTFDVVSPEGTYIGGVITPGPQTAMADLASRAAQLFEVNFERPRSVVGRTTSEQMKSGMFYGTVDQVDGLVDRIFGETGFSGGVVVATGGLASGIERHSRHISQVIPTLTLDGLRLIWEANR